MELFFVYDKTMFDFHMVRNASGYVVRIEGITEFMLQWLSYHFKFTYGQSLLLSNILYLFFIIFF